MEIWNEARRLRFNYVRFEEYRESGESQDGACQVNGNGGIRGKVDGV